MYNTSIIGRIIGPYYKTLPVKMYLSKGLIYSNTTIVNNSNKAIKVNFNKTTLPAYNYLIQNSQAVKKECGPEKGYGEKRCEIQGGGQEMAVMVG